MTDVVNPRQFASSDFIGDIPGIKPVQLALPPAYGSQPVDFTQQNEIKKNLALLQKARGTYVEPGYEKQGGRAQEWADEEIKAQRDAQFRERAKEEKAAQELAAQREQAQRNELSRRIRGQQSTPHPFETETELETVHRLMKLPPPIQGEPTSSTPPTKPERQPLPSTGSPPPTPVLRLGLIH